MASSTIRRSDEIVYLTFLMEIDFSFVGLLSVCRDLKSSTARQTFFEYKVASSVRPTRTISPVNLNMLYRQIIGKSQLLLENWL